MQLITRQANLNFRTYSIPECVVGCFCYSAEGRWYQQVKEAFRLLWSRHWTQLLTQCCLYWLEDRSLHFCLRLQNEEIAQDYLPFSFRLKQSMKSKKKNQRTWCNFKACSKNAGVTGYVVSSSQSSLLVITRIRAVGPLRQSRRQTRPEAPITWSKQ